MTWTMIVLYGLLTSSSTAIPVLRTFKWHHQSKVVAHVGATVIFNCSTLLDTRSNTYSNITWYKFGQPLGEISYRSMRTVFVNDSHVVKLDNLLLADSGLYQCIGDGSTGTRSGKITFHLSVKEKESRLPPIILENNLYKSVKAGQTVALKCRARSGAIPYFQWFYSKKINISNDQVIEKHNILSNPRQITAMLHSELNGTRLHEDLLWIHNASFRDSGLYICMVFNKHGKDFQRIQLTVLTVPNESSTVLEVQHITKQNNGNSLSSKIPMIILIALPAGLFILSCSAVIRSLEQTRQARIARKRQQNNHTDARDENENNSNNINPETNIEHTVQNVTIHQNHNYFNHIQYTTRTIDHDTNDHQLSDSEVDSISSSAPEPEVDDTSSPLDILSNLSRQSSGHMTSTEAPLTTSTPPHELSSSSVGLELEWEGLDLVLPEGSEFVEMSKEADV